MKFLLPVAALLMSLVAACVAGSDERGDYKTVGSDGWLYGDTLVFGPLDCDSASRGDLVVVVRHGNGYLYSNIWLEMTRQLSDTVAVTDTFNIALADPMGRWYGKGLGLSYQRADTVLKNIVAPDSVPVKIRHIMRQDTLEAIEQIGVVFVAKQ